MPATRSDRAWERFGATDPYFGVLSDPRFRAAADDGPERREFFASGDEHVREVLATIRTHLDPGFSPTRALDFGCGVGRTLIPLARRAHSAVGIDVSPGMLAEARRNCEAEGLRNVSFIVSDEGLSGVEDGFDLVHSFIVFQHVPPPRGEALARVLLSGLAPGGVAVLHFTYASDARPLRNLLMWVRRHVPLAHPIANLVQGRRIASPLMEMHAYRLDRLFSALTDAGCHRVHLRFTRHGAFRGVVLFAQKVELPTL